jgi:pimeloyl-ACP methyl ester carboxylesterase
VLSLDSGAGKTFRSRLGGVMLVVVLAVGSAACRPMQLVARTERPITRSLFIPTFTPTACDDFSFMVGDFPFPVEDFPFPGEEFPIPSESGDDPLAERRPSRARCGYVSAPLHHDDAARGTILIAVAVLPATDPAPGPKGTPPTTTPAGTPATSTDPLLMLAGGPGQHLLENLPLLDGTEPPFDASVRVLHEDRDLILIDQRGVGASKPALRCPSSFQDPSFSSTGSPTPADVIRACHDQLSGANIDLSAFTTLNIARDLDLVREALGYGRVHLYGTSYGTLPALHAARLFPDTVASVVLSSPIPTETNYVADRLRSFDRAVRAISEVCAADETCARDYPDVYDTLVSALAALPTAGTASTPSGAADRPGSATTAWSPRAQAATGLSDLLYLPEGATRLPHAVRRLAQWALDPTGEPPADLLADPGFDSWGMSGGMYLSILCTEQIPRLGDQPAGADTSELVRLLAEVDADGTAETREACRIWDVEPAPAETFTPATSLGPPLLIVTGQFDHMTPPGYGEAIRDANPHSIYVEVKGGAHDPVSLSFDCMVDAVADFVADPRARLNTRCARRDLFTFPSLAENEFLDQQYADFGDPFSDLFPTDATPGNEAACQVYADTLTHEMEALPTSEDLDGFKALFARLAAAVPEPARADVDVVNRAVQAAATPEEVSAVSDDGPVREAAGRARAWIETNCGFDPLFLP